MRSIFTGPNFIICGGQDQLAAPKRPWPLARVLSYWSQHFPTPKRLQIVLARPLAIPRLPPRIIRVEVQAAQCLRAAMRTALNVAARAMALADRRAAIGTGSEFLAHAPFPKPEINCRALINKRSQVVAGRTPAPRAVEVLRAFCGFDLAHAINGHEIGILNFKFD
jgi:hypothetical protein